MEVLVVLDILHLPQVPRKHCRPVVDGNNGLPFLATNQLRNIDGGRGVDDLNKIVQAAYNCASETLFEETEALIWGELRVSDDQEREGDALV